MQRKPALPDTFGRAALTLANAGRVPLPSFTKAPETAPGCPLPWKQWQHRQMTTAELQLLIDTAGHAPMTGMVLSDTDLVVDIDADDPVVAENLHVAAIAELGNTPQVRFGRGHRRQLFYRTEAALTLQGLTMWAAMQLMRAGKQTIVGGIHPDTGKPYTWIDPSQVPWKADAPIVNNSHVGRFLSMAREIAPPPKVGTQGAAGRTAYFRQLAAHKPAAVALSEALSIVAEGERHYSLVALLGAAIARGLGDDDIRHAVATGAATWTWTQAELEKETDRALRDFRASEVPFTPILNITPPRGPKLSRMARRKLQT